jgi:hypothetical protein
MADQIIEYLKENPPLGFHPLPFYSAAGEFLSMFFEDEDHYAERIDQVLTVYRSMRTQRLVGFKINGARRILEALVPYKEAPPEGGSVKMCWLFFPGRVDAYPPNRRKSYDEVIKATADLSLDPSQLLRVAVPR